MQVSWTERSRRPNLLEVVALIGVVGLLIARYVPVARLIPFWGCAFRRTTGFPCPGCGLTRAADHFAHLHFHQSFAANPLGMLAACAFVAAIALSVVHLTVGLRFPRVDFETREWKWLRNVGLALLCLNYLFVILQHKVGLL